jgi:hypothetical protein
MENNPSDNFATLKSNLFLFSLDSESLKAYLKDYSEFGMYTECIEGVRESMATFSSLIESQNYPALLLAKVFDFYFTMEILIRSEFTNNYESFQHHVLWQKLKTDAKNIAEEMDAIVE